MVILNFWYYSYFCQFLWSSLQPQTKRFGMSQWMIKSSPRHLNNFYSQLATLDPLPTKSWTYFIIPSLSLDWSCLKAPTILITQMKYWALSDDFSALNKWLCYFENIIDGSRIVFINDTNNHKRTIF